ncbi:MAG: ABC transporter ATP-binding protein [Nitrospinota bacterium]|nr:ABC transporter ATP-binding protein [Nitrospinota bacterium]
MGDTLAISAQNVSKKYRLFNSPKERLWETLHPFNKKYHREFWALKEIDFQVPKGATVGIIGQNGSGKSTLLKIICSVLKPTTGSIQVNGEVSALLSLGAGLNPKFTGRDNVLFKGSLMGIPPEELKDRMEDIEAFADIGEFFEQPLQIYSSGMMLRLAFAIAINVDPDILVIDEVIAVGDAKFKQKCFQKFREFQESGKTILITTHDTNTITRHCDHALLINKGSLIEAGEPKEVIRHYLNILENKEPTKPGEKPKKAYSDGNQTSLEENLSVLDSFLNHTPAQDNCPSRKNYNKNEKRQDFQKAEIIDYLIVYNNTFDPTNIYSGDRIDIYLKVKFHELVELPLMGIAIKTVDGVLIYGFNSFYTNHEISAAQKGDILIGKFSLKLRLKHGDYFFDLGVDLKESAESSKYVNLDRRCAAAHLRVIERNQFFGLADFEADFDQVLDTTIKPASELELESKSAP